MRLSTENRRQTLSAAEADAVSADDRDAWPARR